MTNEPNQSSRDSAPTPSERLAIDLLRTIGAYSQDQNCKVSGEATIETHDPAGLCMRYATFPNGDYLCWFLELGYFRLFSLVNEKIHNIARFPASEAGKMQELIDSMKEDFGKSE